MQIIVNGIPRSGSTLVRQLVAGCIGEVIHTHPAAPVPNDHAFVTIRHPHDVLASRYRIRLSRDPSTDGMSGLEAEYNVMAEHFDALREVTKHPHTLLRYERFYNNYDHVFDAIEVVADIRVPHAKRIELKARYSLEANRARAAKLANFHVIDEEKIHGDHIGTVHPGHWSFYMPAWSHRAIRQMCRRLCEEYDYE